jgi:penicillin-binding protein 1A
MVDMMKGVLQRGTGVRGQIGRPAAAKTGTTENFKDAWFIGFVPQLVTGVWIGNDDNTPMQGVAEVAVCPRIWREYNLIALAGTPPIDFPKPEGLANIKICTLSGQLAGPYCPTKSQRWATLWKKDVPRENCTKHQGQEQIMEENLENTESEPVEEETH